MDAAWIKKELPDVNFTTEQATALAHVMSNLATKDDVQTLRQHVDAGFKEVYQEFGKLQREVGQIWWKMAVILMLQAGLIVSLMKLL